MCQAIFSGRAQEEDASAAGLTSRPEDGEEREKQGEEQPLRITIMLVNQYIALLSLCVCTFLRSRVRACTSLFSFSSIFIHTQIPYIFYLYRFFFVPPSPLSFSCSPPPSLSSLPLSLSLSVRSPRLLLLCAGRARCAAETETHRSK